MKRLALALTLLPALVSAQGVRLTGSTPEVTTSGSSLWLSPDTIKVQRGNITVLPSGRIQIAEAGWYATGLRLSWPDLPDNVCTGIIRIERNGDYADSAMSWVPCAPTTGTANEVTEVFYLEVGDIVIGKAFQMSGHDVAVSVWALWAVKVGD